MSGATTTVAAEYLMTLHAPIAGAPQRIDDTLTIFHSDTGTVEGPRIKGRILAPTGDWLRTMPGGTLRVDARMSIATDDGAQIHVQYGGVIAIAPADFARMAGVGASLIWSPRSNVDLYGFTAQVTMAANLGVRIALGSDWTASGSMNMIRELRCADELNQTYFDHYFTDKQLWEMVTVNAAAVTAMDDAIGLLTPDHVADITIFAKNGKPHFRAVLEAQPEDVALVMRGGKVLYGDDARNGPKPVVEMFMKADVGHRFWLGKVNISLALAKGEMRAKGPVPKILKLVPLAKGLFPRYREKLEREGRTDMLEV